MEYFLHTSHEEAHRADLANMGDDHMLRGNQERLPEPAYVNDAHDYTWFYDEFDGEEIDTEFGLLTGATIIVRGDFSGIYVDSVSFLVGKGEAVTITAAAAAKADCDPLRRAIFKAAEGYFDIDRAYERAHENGY